MRNYFDKNGNLHETIALSFEEFQQYFGTTSSRKEKIKTALQFFKLFNSCGCTTVYIGGSFASTKRNPNDIDLCFDLNSIDEAKLKKELPDIYGPNRFHKISEIRRIFKCHVFTFESDHTDLYRLLQRDKKGNPKGLIKISLKGIDNYD